MGSSGVDMTIRSITVYSDVGPWGNWEPAIREEMARLNIPYSEKDRIAIKILRPLSAKPKRKKQGDLKAPIR
jgi:hypothetical protein